MLKLRGHHLLCLHGFRGFGYSPEFVANMKAVQDELIASPSVEVEILITPDDICSACPHLSDAGCSRTSTSEVRISRKDAYILSRLSLSPGDRLSAGELFALVADKFRDGIEDVCSSCSWFPQGWCQDGVMSGEMVSRLSK